MDRLFGAPVPVAAADAAAVVEAGGPAVMGSVAGGVIRRCPVPVPVVRLPDAASVSEALAA